MSQLSKPSIDFGLKFLQEISKNSDPKNVILSPLSVIIAYCLVLEGATGETEKQIKEILNLDKIESQVEDISKMIKQLLESYKTNEDYRKCILEFGNLLLVNSDSKLLETFVQSLLTDYFADALNEDFNQGKQILEKVNSWVSKNTKNKIVSILDEPPKPIDALLLVNTIYFEGKWLIPFSPSCTIDRTFNNADGSTIETKMMHLVNQPFNYADHRDKKLKIVEIPYFGNFSMVMIMPTDDNNLKKVIATLDSNELFSLLDSMKITFLNTLAIPKFKLEDYHKLSNILPKMGMNIPFDHKLCELPKVIEKPQPLWISESIHKALIEVSETGTIAAAITGTLFECSSIGSVDEIITFIADRPFLYLIRDNSSQVTLCIGQLNNMSEDQSL